MREFLALLILIILLLLGWKQPFAEHWSNITGKPVARPVRRAPPARQTSAYLAPSAADPAPTPSPDRSWMWERGKMAEPYGYRPARGR